MLKHILQLTRLDRLRGAILLFWPTWASLRFARKVSKSEMRFFSVG